MPTIIYADETPETIREIASFLCVVAERIETTAKVLDEQQIEKLPVPLKKSLLDGMAAIDKWTAALHAAYFEQRKSAGAYGQDTSGKGPTSGRTYASSRKKRKEK